MNREAKIGMLTGLAVILFVGVLLSNYFEHNTDRAAPMADVKEGYRSNALATVGVPALADGLSVSPTYGRGAEPRTAGDSPMMAFAAGSGKGEEGKPVDNGTETTVGEPVKAVAVGDIPTGSDGVDGGLDKQLAGGAGLSPTVYVAGDPTKEKTTVAKPAAPVGTVYVIVKNDNLRIIAKKNYRTATNADVARIIAANPKELKDIKSVLVAGHKLLIPPLPVVAKPETKPVPAVSSPGVSTGTISMPVVTVPGAGGTGVKAGEKPASAEQSTVKPVNYKVQKGDTLEKLAGKLLGSRSNEAQQKLAAFNNLKAPYALQVDQVIKVPAKAAGSEPKKETKK